MVTSSSVIGPDSIFFWYWCKEKSKLGYVALQGPYLEHCGPSDGSDIDFWKESVKAAGCWPFRPFFFLFPVKRGVRLACPRIDRFALLPDPSALTAGRSIRCLEQKRLLQEAPSPSFGSVKHFLVRSACHRTKAATIEGWRTNKSQCERFFSYFNYKQEKEGNNSHL